MPRNMIIRKDELEVRILKMKNELYDGSWYSKNADYHDGAQHMLNRVLDMLGEYRDYGSNS